MPDVYRKIEKRIVSLKEKEELWKNRYREIAKQIKELVDSTSEQMNQMGNAIKGFEARIEEMETETRKTNERSGEMLRLMEKKLTEMSEFAKSVSEKLEEEDGQIKKLKVDVVSQVNAMIAKHEKTFESVIEKIDLAFKRMENELQREESLYGKMETAKRFMESYTPPDSPKSDPPPKKANEVDFVTFPPKLLAAPQQSLPPAPVPERFEPETPFIYEPGSPIASPPSVVRRRAPRRSIAMDDLDDDMDVDDVISGNMKGFKDSVESVNYNVSSITEKLASIEEKVAKMQSLKTPGLERLDDKIRMYSESVADIHSRMETVEKAIRDGMTPMMESLKLLTESVKSLKQESKSRPSLAKPTPPKEQKELI